MWISPALRNRHSGHAKPSRRLQYCAVSAQNRAVCRSGERTEGWRRRKWNGIGFQLTRIEVHYRSGMSAEIVRREQAATPTSPTEASTSSNGHGRQVKWLLQARLARLNIWTRPALIRSPQHLPLQVFTVLLRAQVEPSWGRSISRSANWRRRGQTDSAIDCPPGIIC